jgi:hypothetical protein
MLDMDLGSGECGGYAVVALRGASMAEAAASAGASRRAVVPIQPQLTRICDNASP